jgi:hypothetical protein
MPKYQTEALMTVENLLSQTPDNTSILQSTKFTFIIPEMPFLKYFCQTVNLPSVSTNEVMIPTPFSNTYRHGDKLNYEAFTITAIIDEDLRVWEETYKWLVGLTRPENWAQYARKPGQTAESAKLYFDGYLTVNTNANNPNIRVKFHNCHPTSIGLISFDTKVDADIIPTADFTFRYDLFEIERLTNP